MDHAVNEIREYGCTKPAVVLLAGEVLHDIQAVVGAGQVGYDKIIE
jgi:hypothetical protein